MSVSLANFTAGDLRIAVSKGVPTGVRLDWTGRSNDLEPGRLLSPFFAAVLHEAELSGGVIEMHFERLAHFNSSTITALIQLIRATRARHLRLLIAYDGTLAWQRLSFEALRVFKAPDGMLQFSTAGGGEVSGTLPHGFRD